MSTPDKDKGQQYCLVQNKGNEDTPYECVPLKTKNGNCPDFRGASQKPMIRRSCESQSKYYTHDDEINGVFRNALGTCPSDDHDADYCVNDIAPICAKQSSCGGIFSEKEATTCSACVEKQKQKWGGDILVFYDSPYQFGKLGADLAMMKVKSLMRQ